jgi:hypothetical protein
MAILVGDRKDASGFLSSSIRDMKLNAIRDATGLYRDVAMLLDDKRDEVEYAAAATLIRPAPAAHRAHRCRKETIAARR